MMAGEFEIDYWGNRFTDEASAEQIDALPGTYGTYFGEPCEVLAAWRVESRREPEGALVAELGLPTRERQVIRLRLRKRAIERVAGL